MKRKIISLLFIFIFACTNVYALEIEYDEKLKVDSTTFLESVDNVYPGDTIEDTITIKNSSNEDKEIFFLVEKASQNTDAELLKKMNLNVVLNYNGITKVIYDGEYSLYKLDEYISLGTYKAGTSGKLNVKVTLPTTLDNTSSLEEIGTKWIFYTEGNKTTTNTINSNITETNTVSSTVENIISESTVSGSNAESSKVEVNVLNPKTGDNITYYIIIFVLSVLFLSLIIFQYSRSIEEDEINEKKEKI